VQFATDSLLGALTFFDTASQWLVGESAGLRILNFRD
jgi:hypothetical protein